MSMQSLHEFLTTAGQTPALAEGLVQAVGEKQGEPAIAAVAAFAQGQGYDVTVEDARTAHQGFKRALEQNGELSDEDLAAVAGGSDLGDALRNFDPFGTGITLGSLQELTQPFGFLSKW